MSLTVSTCCTRVVCHGCWIAAGLEVLCVFTHQRTLQDPANPEVSSSGTNSIFLSCSCAGSVDLLQFQQDAADVQPSRIASALWCGLGYLMWQGGRPRAGA